ncbi:hypothetical protein S245_059457, partial [Arachis hypogaea]
FGATSTRCEVCRWCCRIGLVVARLREHHFEIATCETLWSSDSASLTLESGSLLFSSPLLLVHQDGSTKYLLEKMKRRYNINTGLYNCSDEVKKQMWDVVSGLQVNLMKQTSMGGASQVKLLKKVTLP